MARVRPDGLERPAHHVGQLAGGEGLPRPARVAGQGRRRHHHPLGRRVPAVQGPRVHGAPTYGDSTARACSTGRSRSRSSSPTTTRPRSRWGSPTATAARRCPRTTTTRSSPNGAEKLGYTVLLDRAVRHQRRALRRAPGRDAGRLQLPGRQERLEVVDAGRRAAQGREDRQPRPAPRQPRRADRARRLGPGHRRALRRPQRRRCAASAPRVVCVAGNSIETPRLLLLSGSAQHPDGLANSSGQVGRNYMRHTTGTVWGQFDKPVNMYRGETMAGVIADESRLDTDRGFVGGYYMETISLGPGVPREVRRARQVGARAHRAARRLPQHRRHVDHRRGHAAARTTASRCPARPSTRTGCRSPTSTSTTTPTTSPCAARPAPGRRGLRRRRRACARSRRRRTRRRTTSGPAG